MLVCSKHSSNFRLSWIEAEIVKQIEQRIVKQIVQIVQILQIVQIVKQIVQRGKKKLWLFPSDGWRKFLGRIAQSNNAQSNNAQRNNAQSNNPHKNTKKNNRNTSYILSD